MSDMDVIPVEDFKQAIAKCCEDATVQAVYANASAGARLFLGLYFYSIVFAEKLDKKQYNQCLSEIEPDVSLDDIDYLMQSLDDMNVKRVLVEMQIAKRKQAKTQEEAVETPVVPQKPKLGRLDKKKAEKGLDQNLGQVTQDTISSRAERMEMRRITSNEFEIRAKRTIAFAAVSKELILFAAIALVIVGATGIIWYTYERRFAEAALTEKMREEARLKEQERRRLEQKEADARAEANRKRAEEERQRLAAEKAAKEKAERERREISERAKKVIAERVKECEGMNVDFWKNRPKELRDGANVQYRSVVTLSDGIRRYFDISDDTEKGLSIKEFCSTNAALVEIAVDDFIKLVRKNPCLMIYNKQCWFCSSKNIKDDDRFAVPIEGDVCDPAKEQFGAMMPFFDEAGIKRPIVSYDIFFLPPNENSRAIFLTNLAYGQTIDRKFIKQKLYDKLRAKADEREREYIRKRDAKLAKERENELKKKATRNVLGNNNYLSHLRSANDEVSDVYIPRSNMYNNHHIHYGHGWHGGNRVIYRSPNSTWGYDNNTEEEKNKAEWERLHKVQTERKALKAQQRVEQQRRKDEEFFKNNAISEDEIEEAMNNGALSIVIKYGSK